MTTLWSLDVALAFARGLLERIRLDGDVDRAMSATKWDLANRNHITVPVLYQRLKNRPLFTQEPIEKRKTADILKIAVGRSFGGHDWWPVSATFEAVDKWLPQNREGRLYLDLAALQDSHDPLNYGRLLGQALFQETIGQLYEQARSRKNERLRILLSVEDPQLQNLRWEWIVTPFANGQWDSLIVADDSIFSLHLDSSFNRPFTFVNRKALTALVVISTPRKDSGFTPTSVAAELSRSGLGATSIEQFVLSSESAHGSAELATLRQYLMSNQYQLLHLTLHARQSIKTSEVGLVMPKGTGSTSNYTAAREFKDQIGRLPSLPHFAFLALPEHAEPGEGQLLAEVARMLIAEAGMYAALAITHEMPNSTLQAFSSHFYKMLQAHGEVDRAYNEAAIVAADYPSFVPPALYSRLGGRPLFYD
jgi:hypothetical protein